MNGPGRNPGLEGSLRIDARARLYLLRRGASIEAIGFDELRSVSNALAGRLGIPSAGIAERDLGTLRAFQAYQALMRRAAPALASDIWFHPSTSQDVRQALKQAKVCRRRVRLYYGDPGTGRDAIELGDTIGWVGRAGAPLPRPVLLAQVDDRGGMPIADDAIVRVQDLDATCDLYRHPRYALPKLTVVPVLDGSTRILIDGAGSVDFDNDERAQRWLRYVQGATHTLPRCVSTAH